MEAHLALSVDERVLARVGLTLFEPPKRRALVGRGILDHELDRVALGVRLAELDRECRAECRVALGWEGEREVVGGRRGEVGALDDEVGRVEHELVLHSRRECVR